MSDSPFTVRPMTQIDLSTCLAFTQAVNWPHRMVDWQLHYSLGNGSVIVDQSKTIVGTILWWDYGDRYATVGLVVVPEYMQGKGLGRKLMNTVMAQTGERHLQLVATTAGKRLYEQCGFSERGRIFQVQGMLSHKPELLLPSECSIRPLSEEHLDLIVSLDTQAYQAQRKALLLALLAAGHCLGLYIDGVLQAFGFVRDSGKGQTIGPLIADNEEHAQILASALLQQTDGFVRFDLIDKAQDLKVWLGTLGLIEVDNVCLMVKGHYQPALATQHFSYALASQAFG